MAEKPEETLSKPGADKKIAEFFKAQKEGRKARVSDTFAQALVGFLPVVVGAAFGGTEGGAIGAQAGMGAFKQLREDQQLEDERQFKLQEQQNQQQFDLLKLEKGSELRREEKALDRQFQAGEDIVKLKIAKTEASQKLTKEIRDRLEKDPITSATKEIAQSFQRIQQVTKEPSAAGDLALIFNYMKMLDPRSVVRESEFANAEAAKAWLTRSEEAGIIVPSEVQTVIQKLKTGQKLLPEQRADFVNKANSLVQGQFQIQKELDVAAVQEATARGADPRFVTNPALMKVRERLDKIKRMKELLKKKTGN